MFDKLVIIAIVAITVISIKSINYNPVLVKQGIIRTVLNK